MLKFLSQFFLLLVLIISGNAFAIFPSEIKIGENNIIKADKFYYDSNSEFLEASGKVRILSGNEYLETENAVIDVKNKKIIISNKIYVEKLQHKLIADSFYYDGVLKKGFAKSPEIQLNESDILSAKSLVKNSDNIIELNKASFTSCKLCVNKSPIWQINSKKTIIDTDKKTVSYKNATFSIDGYKILYLPFFGHPMPDAKRRSGILMPEIDNGTLKIPLYLRTAPHFDLTYSPRFNSKLLIHELEYRHLFESGSLKFTNYYSKSRIKNKNKEKPEKSKKFDRYFTNLKGVFINEDSNFGLDVGKVSDKSFLKNNYDDHRSFVKSKLYASQYLDNGYNHIDVQHYQGLRQNDSKFTDPNALPNINVKRDLDLENGMSFSLQNNTIEYYQRNSKDIFRNSLSARASMRYNGDGGQILGVNLHNRFDAYKISKIQDPSPKSKELYRNIPELGLVARAPLYSGYNNINYVLEPEVSYVIGKRDLRSFKDYNLIDSRNIDINETNIFHNSRYTGIDYYESGRRFNYGFNNYFLSNNWKISAFIGQTINSDLNSSNTKSNYLGKISLGISDNFETYYRFQRRSKNFTPYRDEIVTWVDYNKLRLSNELTLLRDLNEFNEFYNQNSNIKESVIKQNYTNIEYDLNKEVTLFSDFRFEILDIKSAKLLSNGYGLTYKIDCISLTAKISNDYTSDPAKGISKTRSYTVKLGLKSINL